MARSLLRKTPEDFVLTKYFPERVWPRLVPKGSVMVSVYGPSSDQAYGVLSDISEGGAQFVAGVLFETNSRVLLRIGFNPEEPFSTPADVVWTRDESDARNRASFAHGVQFRIEDPEQRDRLRTILRSTEFERPTLPGAPGESPGLSQVVRDLGEELAGLGDRIRNES